MRKILAIVMMILMIPLNVMGELSGLDGIANIEHTPPPIETSYGFKEDMKFTTWNKVLFGASIGGHAADALSTIDALDRGCVEANPILGEHPSTGLLIGLKVLAIAGVYWVTESYLVPEYGTNARNYVYAPIALLGGAVTYHNYNVKCR